MMFLIGLALNIFVFGIVILALMFSGIEVIYLKCMEYFAFRGVPKGRDDSRN